MGIAPWSSGDPDQVFKLSCLCSTLVAVLAAAACMDQGEFRSPLSPSGLDPSAQSPAAILRVALRAEQPRAASATPSLVFGDTIAVVRLTPDEAG